MLEGGSSEEGESECADTRGLMGYALLSFDWVVKLYYKLTKEPTMRW